ncbi:hypothetical protein PC129_g17683 [Phytophthora cactorum]|uniref:Uncharacterized protein n=1 Tax=Phytophthora cactorum TaxID=29920 RepID=A0A329SVE1_9STRA|nr:hypothetical protein Pcac1_g2507 [Phytophthora cactorum]KAG2832147.1 hypothetical protein PC111_g6725 [Phytophthora cactorum]KAG2835089.1 hypothetical protein PC112_g5838 [Phytophthora cactorum]KAG2860405.1 hypothetical protein PC113_g8081 [Phytophthora cactorum]KAG2914441.1 hypothetical protein PC114_g8174 [Phytophthora cactorum]
MIEQFSKAGSNAGVVLAILPVQVGARGLLALATTTIPWIHLRAVELPEELSTALAAPRSPH